MIQYKMKNTTSRLLSDETIFSLLLNDVRVVQCIDHSSYLSASLGFMSTTPSMAIPAMAFMPVDVP